MLERMKDARALRFVRGIQLEVPAVRRIDETRDARKLQKGCKGRALCGIKLHLVGHNIAPGKIAAKEVKRNIEALEEGFQPLAFRTHVGKVHALLAEVQALLLRQAHDAADERRRQRLLKNDFTADHDDGAVHEHETVEAEVEQPLLNEAVRTPCGNEGIVPRFLQTTNRRAHRLGGQRPLVHDIDDRAIEVEENRLSHFSSPTSFFFSCGRSKTTRMMRNTVHSAIEAR